MFAQMGFAEYLGTGIRKISDLCEIYSRLKPKFVDNDIFIAEIPLTDHVPEGEKSGGLNVHVNDTLNGTLNGTLNVKQKLVLDFITTSPGTKAQVIIDQLSIPRDTLNKILKVLIDRDLVERRGSKKTGGYYAK